MSESEREGGWRKKKRVVGEGVKKEEGEKR